MESTSRDAYSERPHRSRRGGVGDAGGLGHKGELPQAALIMVRSDMELAAEIEAAAAGLAHDADWVQRVEALLRLEGLAKGGAAERPALPDLLLGLRDVLAAQLQERRSAVSRQACHAISLLAAACGGRFEPLAVHLLPVLFKTLAMGIQVVNDTANACAHTLLRHCQSARLLPKLLSTVTSDRSGKLRQVAAEYLLQVLEEWPPVIYERQQNDLEHAMLAAARDAQAETRTVGRVLYAAYARACPGPASALMRRLDPGLQEKLAAAMQSYVPGALVPVTVVELVPACCASAGVIEGHSSFGGAAQLNTGTARPGPVPRLALSSLPGPSAAHSSSPSAPFSARSGSSITTAPGPRVGAMQSQRSTARENRPENAELAAGPAMGNKPQLGQLQGEDCAGATAPQSLPPRAHTAREHLYARRSVGGAALRVSMAAIRDELAQDDQVGLAAAALAGGSSRVPRRVSVHPGALRIMRPPPLPPPAAPGPAGPAQAVPQLQAQVLSPGATSDQRSVAGSAERSSASWRCEEAQPATLAQLLSQAAKPGIFWRERVERLQQLEAAVQQTGPLAAADMAGNAERLVALLLDAVGDPHFKVAAAALQALAAGLSGTHCRVLEPHLDRLVPALFARVVDAKEQIRQLAGDALAALPRHHPPEAVVSAMARALGASKAPRVRCAVLRHYTAAASDPAQVALLGAQGPALRALLSAALGLAQDKAQDTRHTAVRMLATAFKAADPGAVEAALATLPSEAAEQVRAAVTAVMRNLDWGAVEQLQVATAQAGPAPTPGQAAPSGSTTSRRRSGEGVVSSRSASGGSCVAAGTAAPLSRSASVGGSIRLELASSQAVGPADCQPFAPQPESPPATSNPSSLPCLVPHSPVPGPAPNAAGMEDAPQQQTQPGAARQAAPRADRQPDSCPLAPPDLKEGQLRRLLGQLHSGPASEVLQGLSRLARVLPPPAWSAHFNQILAAVFIGLDSGTPALQEAALMLVRDLAAVLQAAQFDPALPTLLPRLMACVAQLGAREVALAADEALDELLARAEPSACVSLLAARLPAEGAQLSADLTTAAALHATVRNLRRAAGRLTPAELILWLDALLPGLRAAYSSPLADVRKASVDCLVTLWLRAGDAAMHPHLALLSASQRKLLAIYQQRAVAGHPTA